MIGEIAAYPLSQWHNERKERATRLLNDASELLRAEGVEPQPVPGRHLWPILEKGSIEDESDTLRRGFARLLASAGHPTRSRLVIPAFASVLSEMSPLDAQIIEKIFEMGLPPYNMPYTISPGTIKEALGTGEDDTLVALQNLARLKIIEIPISTLRRIDDERHPVNELANTFHVTAGDVPIAVEI